MRYQNCYRVVFAIGLAAAGVGCGGAKRSAPPPVPTEGAKPMTEDRTYDLVVTRALAAPVAAVWAAWSEGEQVRQWWAPTGFTTPLAAMDFRVGGTSRVSMKAPAAYGGGETFMAWTYSAIEPHQRIAFGLVFTDAAGAPIDPAAQGMPPGIPAEVRHVITFAPSATGGTTLTVAEYGYTTAQAHDLSKAGLEQTLDKLAALLTK